MALELGAGYVTILPSVRGFGRGVQDQVNRDLKGAGNAPGKRYGTDFVKAAGAGTAGLPKEITKQSSLVSRMAGKSGDGGGRNFGKKFSGAAKAAIGAGMAMVGALVVSKMAGFVSEAVAAASEMEQSQGGVAAIFGKNSKLIESAASKAAQAVGLSANEYRGLAASLGAQLKNKGMTTYADETQKLIVLGADLAAQFGGSTKDAVDSINSAMRGENNPIEKYGVSINQTAIKAEAMRLKLVKTNVDTKALGAAQLSAEVAQSKYNAAVKKFGKNSNEAKTARVGMVGAEARVAKAMGGSKVELNESQKSTAALSLIRRQTADATGTFAREEDTLAGKQERAKAATEDLKAAIGEQLLPIYATVTEKINKDVIPAVSNFVKEFKDGEGAGGKLKTVLTGIVAALGFLVGPLAPVTFGVLGLAIAFGTLKTVLALATGAQAAFNLVMSLNPIVGVILLLVALGTGLYVLYQKNETFRKGVQAVWNFIKGYYTGAWNIIKAVFEGIKNWVTVTLPAAWTSFKDFMSSTWDKVKNKAKSAWTWIDDKVIQPFKDGLTAIQTTFDTVKTNLGKMWDGLKRTLYKPMAWTYNNVFVKLANVWDTMAGSVGLGDKKFNISAIPEEASFSRGGYTGPGSKYQPAGLVHADEFVLRKEATNRIRREHGLGVLDNLNATGQMPGYARGGLVGGKRSGLNAEFLRRLDALVQGTGIGYRVNSGYRSIAEQTALWNRSDKSGRMVGRPGGSMHNFGLAADIAPHPRSNAELARYKLYRPMSYEPWHVQPIGIGKSAGPGPASPLGALAGFLPPGAAMMLQMAEFGRKALLGQLNKKFPGSLEFNKPMAAGGDTMATAVNDKLAAASEAYAMTSDPGNFDPGTVPAGKGSARWRETVITALGRAGLPRTEPYIAAWLRQIQSESGGNPGIAQQIRDVNGTGDRAGVGLVQVIPGTFAAYRDPGLPNDRRNPLANVTAGMRYAKARYGSRMLKVIGHGHGYAEGGLVSPQLYDSGGVLAPGLTLVSNQTGKPETVRTFEQEQDLRSKSNGGTQIVLNAIPMDHVSETLSALDFAMAQARAQRR